MSVFPSVYDALKNINVARGQFVLFFKGHSSGA